MTILRRALGLEHIQQPEDEHHDEEHERVERRLESHARRLRALDRRIDVQRASRR